MFLRTEITLNLIHDLVNNYQCQYFGKTPSFVIVSYNIYMKLKREWYEKNGLLFDVTMITPQGTFIISSPQMEESQVELVAADPS